MSEQTPASRPRPRPKPSATAASTSAEPSDSDTLTAERAVATVKAKASPPPTSTSKDSDDGSDAAPLHVPKPWVISAAVLLVALLVLNIILFVRHGNNDDAIAAQSKRDSTSAATTYGAALASAKQRVPRILSYNYTRIDQDIAAISQSLTGAFKNDYTSVLAQRVKPRAVQLKVVTTSTQSGAAIVNSSANGAVSVLVFVNQQTTSGSGTPEVAGSRVQVTMKKVGNNWLISDLAVV